MERLSPATATVALCLADKELASTILEVVRDESTIVRTYGSLHALVTSMADVSPDIVILDDRDKNDAERAIRKLRRRQPSLCIVYLSVRQEERTVELLRWGADDAIPNDSPVMLAKLQAAARRARTLNAGARIAIADVVFDRETRRVWCAGREVVLTPHEYSVVDCLFWHSPTPVGVDTLADFVWGDDSPTSRKTAVQVYISYVRKKLAASAHLAIAWTHGLGYQFAPKQRRKRR